MSIISTALDTRLPISGIIYQQATLLKLSRIIMPGLFAIAVAMMIPTISRFYQILSVVGNYLFFAIVCAFYFPNQFTQPTSWVVCALCSTLFLIPDSNARFDNELQNHRFYGIWSKIIGICIVPSLILLTLVVVIRNVDNTILLTLTQNFLDSNLGCIFIPIYETMLGLGFSSVLNTISGVQGGSEIINAFLNSILLTNILSLPSIVICRALFTKEKDSLFLAFLAMTIFLTSKNGLCISIELTILLIFYSGTLTILLISSVILYFVTLHLSLGAFTSFENLYHPDLQISALAFTRVQGPQLLALFLAMFIPFSLELIFLKLAELKKFKLRFWQNVKNLGYNVDKSSSSELVCFALIKALGGKSNLRSVQQDADTIIVKVLNNEPISIPLISTLCQKKPKFEENNTIIKMNLGIHSYLIKQRLLNIVLNNDHSLQDDIQGGEYFNIANFCATKLEKNYERK